MHLRPNLLGVNHSWGESRKQNSGRVGKNREGQGGGPTFSSVEAYSSNHTLGFIQANMPHIVVSDHVHVNSQLLLWVH